MFFQCTRCGQETGLLDQDYRCQKDASVLLICSKVGDFGERELIDICVDQQAFTLIFQNQEDETAIAKEQEFVLRNWIDYDLQTKIKYNAEKAGIELIIG